MTKIVLEKVAKELTLAGIGGYGDHLTKLFGGLKPCYNGH